MHLVMEPSSFIFTFFALRAFLGGVSCPKPTTVHVETALSELSKIPVSVQVVTSMREQHNRYRFKAHINMHLYSMCQCITSRITLVISV